MHQVIQKIQEEFKANSSEEEKIKSQRFFKEDVKFYGLRSKTVDQIAQKYWGEIKDLQKKELFEIFEELYQSEYYEDTILVPAWAPKLVDQFQPEDIYIFKNWIEKYVTNWANCDTLCNHTVGDFLQKYPESINEIKSWSKSNNRWLKRASAVSLIIPAKRGEYLKEAFEIADQLLEDKDDMVQKGYGWLLKDESITKQKEVFDYVMKNKKKMPRTALRYAIERMPKELKVEAMKKD